MAVLLAEPVTERPDAVAVVDARGSATWRQLDERVNRLVHALRDRGLRSGDSIVAMLGNQAEAIELSLACLHGGWVLVPVNWHWVTAEVAYVLDDADAAALVVDGRWLDVVKPALSTSTTSAVVVRLVVDGEDPAFTSYEDALAAASSAELEDAERGGPMFYTSGTTGKPRVCGRRWARWAARRRCSPSWPTRYGR